MGKKPKTPRGIRNNNPLNIVNNPTFQWVGQIGSDGRFCRFSNMKYGVRAAFCLLHTYQRKRNIRSVSEIIKRWAPPSENHTNAYIKAVCANDLQPSTIMNFSSDANSEEKSNCLKLVYRMAQVENGQPIDFDVIVEGWNLVFKSNN